MFKEQIKLEKRLNLNNLGKITNYYLEDALFQMENLDCFLKLFPSTEEKNEIIYYTHISDNEKKQITSEVLLEVNEILGVKEAPMPKIVKNNYIPLYYGYGGTVFLNLMAGIFSNNLLQNHQDEFNLGISGLSFLLSGAISIFLLKQAHKTYNEIKSLGASFSYPNKIVLNKNFRENFIPALAHEYTHYLMLNSYDIEYTNYQMFTEGFACAVEEEISKIHAKKENKPSFLIESKVKENYLNLFLLSDFAEKLGLDYSFHNNLLKEIKEKYYDKQPFHYKGIAAFKIAQKKHPEVSLKDLFYNPQLLHLCLEN